MAYRHQEADAQLAQTGIPRRDSVAEMQLKRELAELPAQAQLDRLRPTAPLQFLAGPGAVQFAGGPGEFPDQGSLDGHYDKHVTNQQDAGDDYDDADAYEKAAMAIVDGGYDETGTKGNTTYYWKSSTSQFVAVRGGHIRTMFVPSAGKSYFDAQIA